MTTDTSRNVKISNPTLFRMARACVGKDDRRPYLNWLLIDFDKGEVVGTDGHRLLVARCIEDAGGRTGLLLVKPDRVIPKSWANIELHIDETAGTGLAVGQVGTARREVRILCEVSDEAVQGKYPDFHLILDKKRDKKAQETIAFNPMLVADLVKAAGTESCQFILHGEKEPVIVKFGQGLDDDCDCVFLAMRWKGLK